MRLWLLLVGVSLGLWAIIRFSQTYTLFLLNKKLVQMMEVKDE